jgi:uncharacterized protein
MSKETAKSCVDLLFKMYEEDDSEAYINKSTTALIFEFIGGEPLLNLDIIDFICSYFMERCVEIHSEWAIPFRMTMISNGQRYFDEDVQKFLDKWQDYLSFSVTVDGPKEMHNSCRLNKNGEGTFDKAFSALKHYQQHYGNKSTVSTKVTVSPDNLPFLGDVFQFFIDNNIPIYSNPVYEHKWTIEEG